MALAWLVGILPLPLEDIVLLRRLLPDGPELPLYEAVHLRLRLPRHDAVLGVPLAPRLAHLPGPAQDAGDEGDGP